MLFPSLDGKFDIPWGVLAFLQMSVDLCEYKNLYKEKKKIRIDLQSTPWEVSFIEQKHRQAVFWAETWIFQERSIRLQLLSEPILSSLPHSPLF
jgi:hypothetical protein